jgi:hypothetical protein
MFRAKYTYDVRGTNWHETTEEKVRRALQDWYKDDADLKMAELKSGMVVSVPHLLFRWITNVS